MRYVILMTWKVYVFTDIVKSCIAIEYGCDVKLVTYVCRGNSRATE